MKNWWSEFRANSEGFTLVELMIVVAIIGILAAIAIPQFMESVQNAKTAEVEQIMSKMADGSVGYFTAEQRGAKGSAGSEPWHSGVTAGQPVGFDAKVFPGGDKCDLGPIPSTLPKAGGKQDPSGYSYSDCEKAVTRKHGVELEDPLYFQYEYTTSKNGTDAIATITATADFDPDVSDDETHTQTLNVNASGEPQKGSAYAENTGE